MAHSFVSLLLSEHVGRKEDKSTDIVVLTHGTGKYVGTFTQDVGPHGHGTLIFPNGARYTGDFRDGRCHGEGVFDYSNGARYIGQFENDMCEGRGIWCNANELNSEEFGWRFEGSFKGGKRHGQGVLSGPKGYRYSGMWVKGIREGNGVEIRPDNSIYTGSFASDLRSGNGSLMMEDRYIYAGLFMNGYMYGRGKLVLRSGTTFEGDFERNSIVSGTMTTSAGVLYKGQFLKFKKHGSGEETLLNGDTFTGHYVDGVMEGNGRYRYSNGDQVDGIWSGGRSVEGVFTTSDGGSKGMGRSGVAPDVPPSFVFSDLPATYTPSDHGPVVEDLIGEDNDVDDVVEDEDHEPLSVFLSSFDVAAAQAIGIENAASVLEEMANAGRVMRVANPPLPQKTQQLLDMSLSVH